MTEINNKMLISALELNFHTFISSHEKNQEILIGI